VGKVSRVGRKLSSTSITGDANGDGKLDANDVLTVQRVVAKITSTKELSVVTLKNMVPTLSYMTNPNYTTASIVPQIADAQYLLFGAVQKYVFLQISHPADLVALPVGGSDWVMSATFLDYSANLASCSSTTVFFEANIVGAYTINKGSFSSSTSHGVVLQASCSSGVFSASVQVNTVLQTTYEVAVSFEVADVFYPFFGLDSSKYAAVLGRSTQFTTVCFNLDHQLLSPQR